MTPFRFLDRASFYLQAGLVSVRMNEAEGCLVEQYLTYLRQYIQLAVQIRQMDMIDIYICHDLIGAFPV